ncbi:LysR family transcriptional regulator [Fastidiosibacter lacustris]|uniref:LysR family transcriptional regulator n=1 Tax=Fastidiosibacter lacustris TaxID=2056695 RepID=UPI000E34D92D|nr:LysR family transcriptional regulator [Fastidiosibacter lacustris]
MDSSDLIILRHLLIEKNISVTAKLMNVSQPAITMRLGKLRIMFKDELLVRDGNKMRLTPKASDMLNPIIRITDEMLVLMSDHDFNPYTTQTVVTIQMTEALTEICAKAIIEKFLNYNNKHKINLTTLSYTGLQPYDHDFKNTDVIIGIPTHIEGYNDEVYSYEQSVLMHDRYFDDSKKSITYEEYIKLPHIVFASDNLLLDIIGRPEPRNICLKISSLRTAVEMLQDRYVMTTSTIITQIFNKKYLPLPFEIPQFPFKLSYPERLKHDKKNRWIRNVCNIVMQDLLKQYKH